MADDRIELKLEIDGAEEATELAAGAAAAKTQLDALATAATELAHASQLQAMAIEAEVEALRHAERQRIALAAAEDAELAALGRSIDERGRAEKAAEAEAEALASNSTARTRLKAAEDAEFVSLERSIEAQDRAAQAALAAATDVYQLGDAEENAARGAALEAKAAQNVAEASRLAAGDVYQLAAAEQAEAGAATAAGSAETGAASATRQASDAKKAAATASRDQATAEKAAARVSLEAQQAAGHAASVARQRMQGLAYSFNDFFGVQGDMSQRLNALANNMPQLFAGMSAKLMGFGLVLSAIIPIIGMIMHNWDALSGKVDEFFGGLVGVDAWTKFKLTAAGGLDFATERVAVLDKRIKELEEKPHKISLDIRELEAAKDEVAKIKEALSVIEGMRKSQGSYEKESGENIMSMFGEEKGGQKGVQEDLVKQRRDEMLGGESGPLKPVMDEIAKVKAEMAANQKLIDKPSTMMDTAADLWKKQQAINRNDRLQHATLPRLEGQRDTIAEQVTGENGLAAQDVGKLLSQATKGQGWEQADAQRQLRERLGKAGRGDLARGVGAASPDQQRVNDEQDAAFESSLDAMKFTGTQNKEKRAKTKAHDAKTAAAAKHDDDAETKKYRDRLTNEIDIVKAMGDVEKAATAATKEAAGKGLKGAAENDFVRAAVDRSVRGQLKARGFAFDAKREGLTTEMVGDLATHEAGAARVKAAGVDVHGVALTDDERKENERRKDERKTIKGSGLSDQAGAIYARARSQIDPKTRKQVTSDQAFEVATNQVLQYLNRVIGKDKFGRDVRANHGMSEDKKNLLATQIVSQGRGDVNAGVKQLAGSNLTATGKLLQVAAGLDAEAAGMQAKLSEMGQQIDGLARRITQRNAQNRGR